MSVLTAAQRGGLPALPVPLQTVLGAPPARLPLQAGGVVARELACGPGDLRVSAGTTRLSGVQRFAHVCILDGGVLHVAQRLVLVATTIYVARAARIEADGVIAARDGHPADGRYESTGGADRTRAAPHAGTPGSSALGAFGLNGRRAPIASGGAAGGSIVLIAERIAVAGTVSASGADGARGANAQATGSNTAAPSPGAGGGSGGGILVRAGELQLSGHISVRGGRGGAGGSAGGQDEADGGAHGTAGAMKLFVDTLQAAPGDLPIDGPVLLGKTVPVDPAPPVQMPGAAYFAVAGHGPAAALVGHSLSGAFLALWRREGGLDTFGYPRTEPLRDNGRLVQYTDRFLLVLDHGQVRPADLGRQLTAGRIFARVSGCGATVTCRFDPTTGHSLSGRFLAYWQAHDGALLLGRPLSEVVVEGNGDGSGRRYPLQWFEKGRLEYHPELAGTRYEMELGLLGVQALRKRGWLP